jgi:hypothetical protein
VNTATAASGSGSLTPFLPLAINVIRRYDMDISIIATIGFTSAAIIGIAVLFFLNRGKSGNS